MDIKITNLTYTVRENFFEKKQKVILKNIDGEFRARELTSVVGPSGSGKTSLLNILSGFKTTNVSGEITLNGMPRDIKFLQNNSAYIMQEQSLFPLLTVWEMMKFAIRFKTGYRLSEMQQNEKIEETLRILGLSNCDNDFVSNMSGGQKKRLSIAVEILHDPKIIFLDEPTTGLDTYSATQCLTYLKDIARKDDRTIIITIHQPSARHLDMFDRIYAISDGQCAYQGTSKNLLPYLKKCNLVCPSSYNPCDFMLEILNNDYGLDDKMKLIEQNNNCDNEEFLTERKTHDIDKTFIALSYQAYSLSFLQQLKILLKRNFLLMNRDITYVKMRLIVCMIVSLLISVAFYQVGAEASKIIFNYRNTAIMSFFMTYTGYYSLMTRFPLDFATIKREHFNRHYSTMAYYMAFILSDMPLLIVNCILNLAVIIPITGQPVELNRLLMIFVACFCLSFGAQGFGLFCGSMKNIKITLVISIPVMIWHIIFSGALSRPHDSPLFIRWMYELDFVKHLMDVIMVAIFGWDREKLPCNELYCHFRKPGEVLNYLGVVERDAMIKGFTSTILICTVLHISTYFNMRRWLKN